MHVFVTGGSGLTGPAIVAELVAAGHTVLGLARSDDAAGRLEALRAQPLRGSLEDLDSLREGARILQVPAVSLTSEQFAGHIGDPFLARCFATDAPVSSDRTRALLGWAPAHATLLEDLETGDYFAAQPA